MRTFAIGDIHGAYLALRQVLDRAHFDYEHDELIILGDVVDGWPDTPLVIEELLKIKEMVPIMGNHDIWAFEWLEFGRSPDLWTLQGGKATMDAYVQRHENLMIKHRENYFKKCNFLMVDEQNRVFVHGGFKRGIKLEAQTPETFMWDRTLAEKAAGETGKSKIPFTVHEFKEIYLGHTTINHFKHLPPNKPHIGGNVILLDTGAGWEGVLTMMDIDTKEYFQSDIVASLYPDVAGRGGRKWNVMPHNFSH
jgi:serine/threonine protein phosphatase 1